MSINHDVTLARLALYAYDYADDPDAAIWNRTGIPEGWRAYGEECRNDANGFLAQAFLSESGDRLVIAFAGTRFDESESMLDEPDWVTNLVGATGVPMQAQFGDAVAYFRALMTDTAIPEAARQNVSFTGHSLGGGMAGAMGVLFDVPSLGFASAPFQLKSMRPESIRKLLGDVDAEILHFDKAKTLADAADMAGYTEQERYEFLQSLVNGREQLTARTIAIQGDPVTWYLQNIGSLPVWISELYKAYEFYRAATEDGPIGAPIPTLPFRLMGQVMAEAMLTWARQVREYLLDDPGADLREIDLEEIIDPRNLYIGDGNFDDIKLFGSNMGTMQRHSMAWHVALMEHSALRSQVAVLPDLAGIVADYFGSNPYDPRTNILINKLLNNHFGVVDASGDELIADSRWLDSFTGQIEKLLAVAGDEVESESISGLIMALSYFYWQLPNGTADVPGFFVQQDWGLSFNMAAIDSTPESIGDDGQVPVSTVAATGNFFWGQIADDLPVHVTGSHATPIRATFLDRFQPVGTNAIWHVQAGPNAMQMEGRASNEVFLGGDGTADDIAGMLGDDVLVGNNGNDTLWGNAGDDFLLGGRGSDSYHFSAGSGSDLLIDIDGQGALFLGDQVITEASRVISRGNKDVWYNRDHKLLFTFERGGQGVGSSGLLGTLYVTGEGLGGAGNQIEIRNYELSDDGDGDLGITFSNKPEIYMQTGVVTRNPFFDPAFQLPETPVVVQQRERQSSTVTLALNSISGEDRDVTLSSSGSAGLSVYYDGELVELGSGMTLKVKAGTDSLTFVVFQEEDIDADQDAVLSAAFTEAGETANYDFTLHYAARHDFLDDPQITHAVPDDDFFGSLVFLEETAPLNLYGNDGQDQLAGGSGSDVIVGDEERDELYGAAGDDRLFADQRVDFLAMADDESVGGEHGGDLLSGQLGNDSVAGSLAKDMIFGGSGDDLLLGGGAQDLLAGDLTLVVAPQHGGLPSARPWSFTMDTLPGESPAGDEVEYLGGGTFDFMTWASFGAALEPGNDVLYGNGGADVLFGGHGDDVVDGGVDGDLLVGGFGNDLLVGGEGDDHLLGSASEVAIVGEGYDGEDEAGSDYLDGGEGNDQLTGAGGDDVLFGGEGSDRLVGDASSELAGNDSLDGQAGVDLLLGNAGDDVLQGGKDDDSLVGAEGNDVAFGGEDKDLVDGSAGNDSLMGDAGDDTLRGGTGLDFLDGGADNDILMGDVDGADESDTVDHVAGVADTLQGGEGDDTVVGQGGDDRLHGDAGDDNLAGDAGADVLEGGAGSDTLFGDNDVGLVAAEQQGADSIDAGADNDVVYAGGGDDQVLGGTGDDLLAGEAGADEMAGGDGDDSLHGDIGGLADSQQGADTLVGDAGNDMLLGYNGDDVLAGGADHDTLYGMEGDDALEGGAGDDVLVGGNGSDRMAGGEGNDTFYATAGSGVDTIEDVSGTDLLYVEPGVTREDIVLGMGSLRIFSASGTLDLHIEGFDPTNLGSSPIEYIAFEDGQVVAMSDFIAERGFTLSGNGAVFGTAARDRISGGSAGDFLSGGAGDDSIAGLGGEDALYGGEGADSLSGGDGDDSLLGRNGDDLLEGDSGNDYLDGGLANRFDTLVGGDGDDTYRLNSPDSEDGELTYFTEARTTAFVIEAADGGTDTLISPFGWTHIPANVEILVMDEGAVTAYGNTASNTIHGNGEDNVLSGSHFPYWFETMGTVQLDAQGRVIGVVDRSYDHLIGAAGNDTLGLEGSFAATLEGGTGNDTYHVWWDDLALENANEGHDTVYLRAANQGVYYLPDHVEDLVVDTFSESPGWGGSVYDVYGNELANAIDASDGDSMDVFGGLGNDTIAGKWDTALYGEDGDDVLRYGGQMYGGAGNDHLSNGSTLDGGEGADTMSGGWDYYVDNVGDLTIEVVNGGTSDRVFSALSEWTLAENVELLEFLNEAASVGIGNATHNGISGTALNDSLAGRLGNDYLYGHAGSDTLQGDEGEDFLFGGDDDDTLEGGAGADQLSGGNGLDVLLGGSGNDELNGDAGIDSLYGGDGADTLAGGEGADLLVGGVGDDTYIVDSADDVTEEADSLDGGIDVVEAALDWTLRRNTDQLVLTGVESLTGTGNALANVITGNTGDNTLAGMDGADTLLGGAGYDVLEGGDGDDLLAGGGGYDVLEGGDGDDLLVGGHGDNILQGGAGNDRYLMGDVWDWNTNHVYDSGGTDTLLIAPLWTLADFQFQVVGGDLHVKNQATLAMFVLHGWASAETGIEYVEDGNGAVSLADLVAGLPPSKEVYLAEDGVFPHHGQLALPPGTDTGWLFGIFPGFQQGAYGSLAINPDATYVYTPTFDVQALAEGQVVGETYAFLLGFPPPLFPLDDTLSVYVVGENDAPQVFGETVQVDEDGLLLVPEAALLANDTDVDTGDLLSVSAVTNVSAQGVGVVLLDGTLRYQPGSRFQSLAAGQAATDVVTYTVSDVAGATASASVSIEIVGANDAPVLLAPLADHTVVAGGTVSVVVPGTTFGDVDDGDVSVLSATLADGAALPAWLQFDAAAGVFTGVAPATAGSYALRVTATDTQQAYASDVFVLDVTASGGGGSGNGHGNAGVGNGEDPPPPGHGNNHNDGPGTGPGNPGNAHGNNLNANSHAQQALQTALNAWAASFAVTQFHLLSASPDDTGVNAPTFVAPLSLLAAGSYPGNYGSNHATTP